MIRVAFSLAGVLICLLIIWITAQAGLARLLAKHAIINASLDSADKSVTLAPGDPESHRVRAAVLYRMKRLPEAAKELEQAVSLRPRDDYLWLELAMLRDELQDSAGASVAFDQSVRLAPHYAYPRWQRGNFLLRQRRFDAAFADLRQAAAGNPDFVPNLLDLAWGISGGNVRATENLAQITTSKMRVAFAGFLAKKGKTREAVEQFALAGDVSVQTRRLLVRDLIATESFDEAFEIWTFGKTVGSESVMIHDGGFEGSLGFEEAGFGWRISRSSQASRLVADFSQRHTGSKSLLIEFKGDSNPDSPLISQLIHVEPSRAYRVNFAARTQNMVTGGLPLAVVHDASGEHKRLGESAPLTSDITDWRVYSLEFQTESNTRAVLLSVQRRNCSTSPCPIFGSIWLDSFSIEAR